MGDRLNGKVALITGGTNGIGKATVEGFMAEGAAGVVFTGNNVEAGQAIAEATGADFIQHAVQDIPGWAGIESHLRDKYGRLDIAFANAGTNTGDGNVEEVSTEAWQNLLDINLTGPMLTIKTAIKIMRDNPGTLAVPSYSTARSTASWPWLGTSPTPLPREPCDCWPNRAVHLAKEGTGIRVNTIHPGVIETPLIEGAINGAPDPTPRDPCLRYCAHGTPGPDGRNSIPAGLSGQ